MRTTLTLDPDAARLLEEEAHRQRKPFKQVVNEALRRALANRGAAPEEPPYRVEPHRTALRPGIDPAKLNELAGELEGLGGEAAVIVPDLNLLLFAELDAFPAHAAARA